MDNKGLKIKVITNTPSAKALRSFRIKLFEIQSKKNMLSCPGIKKT
jgi:hypothetical protein